MKNEVNNIVEGVKLGTGMMLMQAPAVNFFNTVSVVACKKDLRGSAAYLDVYKGGNIHAPHASMLNFLCGMNAHLAKEAPRLLFKPAGLYTLKPILDVNFNPQYAIFLFAASLSLAEILVNPADSIRVQRQSGKPIDYSFSALSKGSLGNGARQFLTWSIFGSVSKFVDEKILKPNQINPSSSTGLGINGIFVAMSLGWIYPIERVKNEVQYMAAHQGYMATARSIYKRGGVSLFFCGVGPKILSNIIQATAASALVSMGNTRNSKA